MLGRNAALLERGGTLVPRAGRLKSAPGEFFTGHHNLGMELLQHPGFVREHGTLDDLTRELAASECARAVVSAESLSFAHHRIGGLARLRDAVSSAGFEPVVVVYFRGQATYARSIYAMWIVVDGITTPFGDFCEHIFRNRGIRYGNQVVPFEFDRLLRPFENIFEKRRIVVRPYGPRTNRRAFLRDFLATVHPVPMDENALQLGDDLNVGGSLASVMAAMHRNRTAAQRDTVSPQTIAAQMGVSQATLDRAFDALDLTRWQRFYDEFAASNGRLADTYGVFIDNAPPAEPPGGYEQLRYIAACEAAWKNAGP